LCPNGCCGQQTSQADERFFESHCDVL
jgi:hypothetical protein